MDPNLLSFLRLLHFLGMAVWVGGALTIGSDVRKTVARGKPHTDMLGMRVNKQLTFGLVAAIVTIGSGLGMIFAIGGFAAIGPRIHAGLTFALVTLGVELFLLRPAVAKLVSALDRGDGRELPPMTKRIAMVSGITHALKLVILVLMVFRIGGR